MDTSPVNNRKVYVIRDTRINSLGYLCRFRVHGSGFSTIDNAKLYDKLTVAKSHKTQLTKTYGEGFEIVTFRLIEEINDLSPNTSFKETTQE